PLTCFVSDTATTEIYTLSLHDALPISGNTKSGVPETGIQQEVTISEMLPLFNKIFDMLEDQLDSEDLIFEGIGSDNQYEAQQRRDRKSTRLNSSHVKISYAVFCLKKKK